MGPVVVTTGACRGTLLGLSVTYVEEARTASDLHSILLTISGP